MKIGTNRIEVGQITAAEIQEWIINNRERSINTIKAMFTHGKKMPTCILSTGIH